MVEPVRVLNLFTIMNRGGAETMVMNYYRHIDRAKVQFDFLVHRETPGDYEGEIKELGGRIFRMQPVRPWSAAAYKAQIKSFFLGHPEYKILHAHMSELACYAFEVAAELGIPIRICHAHNRPYGFDLKTPVRWLMKKQIKPYVTDMFICGQESGVWLFGKENVSRFHMLNNAIDAKQFTFNNKIREQVRTELGLSNEPVIGHVGRFCTQKNHTFLLEIFAEFLKIAPNAKLILVGDGELREEILRKIMALNIENSVMLLGIRKDIPRLLQGFDLFLFPSLFEGLSVAIVEAQTAGLPCVISDKVPIECKKTELVNVFSLSESAAQWAKKMPKLLGQPRLNTYETIKDAGFDVVENAKTLQEYYLQRMKECEQ